jgi:hypothetical protein
VVTGTKARKKILTRDLKEATLNLKDCIMQSFKF